jgi:hypothetical protein
LPSPVPKAKRLSLCRPSWEAYGAAIEEPLQTGAKSRTVLQPQRPPTDRPKPLFAILASRHAHSR